MLAQRDWPLTLIPEIRTPWGGRSPPHQLYLMPFGNFMTRSTHLYCHDPSDLAEHLDPLAVGWLLGEEHAAWVGTITPEEVLDASKSFPARKSLGLPIKFCGTHGNLLAPIMASLYSQCLFPMFADWRIAILHVPCSCSFYPQTAQRPHLLPLIPTHCPSFRILKFLPN